MTIDVKVDPLVLDEQVQAISKIVARTLSSIAATDLKGEGTDGIVAQGTFGTFGTLSDTFGTFGSYAVPPVNE